MLEGGLPLLFEDAYNRPGKKDLLWSSMEISGKSFMESVSLFNRIRAKIKGVAYSGNICMLFLM